MIRTILFPGCIDGNFDVAFDHANDPKVYYGGRFVRICGDHFWDNNNGANVFCQQLGYEAGTIVKSSGVARNGEDALYVGECPSSAKSLSDCKGDPNAAGVKSIKKHEDCTASVPFAIQCTGVLPGRETRTSTCIGITKSISYL